MHRTPQTPGAPDIEHLRSPSARRTAALAAQSALFFAHYEQRVALPWPNHWRPAASEALETMPVFVGGVLPEPKYGAFRHDLLIASFHPGHRAQWTAHELCHALVGFAYRPAAPVLFHALAAWLAELLPVSLWYFFDEAGLQRCPRHDRQGPLFQTHCDACEQMALLGPRTVEGSGSTGGHKEDAHSRRLIRDGLKFMDRELAAMARSRRLGRCEGTRFATIDLASDALAYAAAHGTRLRAPEMERWAAAYFGKDQGLHDSLDALEERVLSVRDAIVLGKRLRPHRAKRWDYVAQDLGYRLLTVRAGLRDARGKALDAAFDALAGERTEAGVRDAIAAYEAITAEKKPRAAPALPTPADVFAVGYDLGPGYGRSVGQIAAGIASACPSAWQALGKKGPALAASFVAEDPPMRRPIGRRFSAWLAAKQPGPVADLGRVEAAITHALPPDAMHRTLPPQEARDERVRLAPHAEVLELLHDVMGVVAKDVPRVPASAERALAVVRGADAQVDVIELPSAVGRALLAHREEGSSRTVLGLSTDDVAGLLQAGLLVPTAYACDGSFPCA